MIETKWQFRLWDTQTATYATRELSFGGIVVAIRELLAQGGILESPDATVAVLNWLELAMDRGTNDRSKKGSDVSSRSWRTPGETESLPGPLRTALRSRALSEQAVSAIFGLRAAEWTARLSPATRSFLERSFVLAELLRGTGTATPRSATDADAAAIEEIAREWAEIVTFDRAACLFRLR